MNHPEAKVIGPKIFQSLQIVLITFCLSMAACNKTTSNETPQVPGNQEKTSTVVYPHDKDFYKNHGLVYTANKEQCLGCHGQDGSGGTAKVSCLQCHQAFPHVKNWVMPDQHPVQFVKNPQSCSICHGDDWKGGKSNVSCLQCHQGFPHPLQWASPSQHGKAYEELKDKSQCLKCHDQKKDPALATQCVECHKSFPHDDNFKLGNKLHKILASSYDGKCLLCHRDYKENMPNSQDPDEGIGCYSCHEGTIEAHWVKPVPTPTPSPGPTATKSTKNGTRLPSGSSPHSKKKN